ncbi:MAG: LytTR family transcriptional regulator [Oscillospiraceae bacterium]|nr:LytTR family transcriptional regulator [Oscillospiraceae bacterium]
MGRVVFLYPTAYPHKKTVCPGSLDIWARAGYTRQQKGGRAVKVEIQLDPSLDEPVVILRAPGPRPEVEALAARLREVTIPKPFTVYREREAVRVSRSMVLRFFAEDKGVSCQTDMGVFSVRQRLYELEEELAGTRFVRVSNSEIVNLDRVTGLDLTLAGTIKMTLEGGTVCWVSRRYVKKIKQALEA